MENRLNWFLSLILYPALRAAVAAGVNQIYFQIGSIRGRIVIDEV